MKFRKLVATTLCFGIIASCVAGCNEKKNLTEEKITISVGNWPNEEANPKLYEERMATLERFKAAYPNIEIIPDEWSYDTKTFIAKAEGGTLPTLYTAHFTEANKIMQLGYAADLSDIMREKQYDKKINEYILDSISYDGRMYLIPISIYSLGIALNLDLFEQAGLIDEDGTIKIPETFDELAQTAKVIKEKTGKAGFVLPTTEHAGGWIFTCLAWNFGAKFMEQDKDGKWKATFNSPECAAALQYIKDLKWKYDVLPSSTLINNSDVRKFVGTTQAAMAIAAPSITEFLVNNYGLDRNLIGFAKIPSQGNNRISLMGGSYYAITPDATPEEIDACIKWIEFADGLTPVLSDVAKDALRIKYETMQANNNLVGLKDISLWNEKAEVETYKNELIEEYRNVDEKHLASYNDQSGVEYQVEEPICAQELYSILDSCIQEVLTNVNVDCAELLEKAAADFQQNFLDYE